MKAARIYIRVSTKEQDLERQRDLIEQTKAQGYYVAGVYEDKASGTKADRPGLTRMIADLQPGDVVIAEKMDRISRAPLPEAEAIIKAIKDKGAKLAIPGYVDLSDIDAKGMTKLVLDVMQDLLMKMALQMAREDWETRRERQAQGIAKAKAAGMYQGRPRDEKKRQKIAELLTEAGWSTRKISDTVKCSTSTVQSVRAELRKAGKLQPTTATN